MLTANLLSILVKKSRESGPEMFPQIGHGSEKVFIKDIIGLREARLQMVY